MSSKRVPTWMGRGILVIASLCVAVIVAEVLVGQLLPRCAQDLYETNRRIGWNLMAGLRTVYAPCAHPWSTIRSKVETNELGLRDVRREREKPSGVFRVLVLGDSFTEALQVEREDGYVARLEKILNERVDSARASDASQGAISKVEVINTGVSGYGTDNELLAFRERYADLGADLVLLAMASENDVYENSRFLVEQGPLLYPDKPYFTLSESGAVILHNQPVPEHQPSPRSYRVALEDFVRSSALHRALTGEPPPIKRRDVRMLGGPREENRQFLLQQYLEEEGPMWAEARALTGALVDLLNEEVKASGGELVVLILPDKRAMHPELLRHMLAMKGLVDEPHRATGAYDKLLQGAQRRNLPVHGLLPALQALEEEGGETGFLEHNSHFSVLGHQAVAQSIAEFLDARDLVPDLRPQRSISGPEGPGRPG